MARCGSTLPFLPFLFSQPQHPPLHLAGRGHRQAVDEFDLLRVFVRRELAAHVLLQLGLQRRRSLVPRGEHDEGLHDMGALGIGAAHHGAVRNRGVFQQAVLDLRGTDAVARTLEHVIGAAWYQKSPSASRFARSPVRHHLPVYFFSVASGFFQYPRKNTGSSSSHAATSPSSPTETSPPASSTQATRCPGYGRPIDPGLAGHSVCELPTM